MKPADQPARGLVLDGKGHLKVDAPAATLSHQGKHTPRLTWPAPITVAAPGA